jgi:hypothetical protein
MTLTMLIPLNAILGAAVAYGLHHLLGHGIRSDRKGRHEIVPLRSRESQRIAA